MKARSPYNKSTTSQKRISLSTFSSRRTNYLQELQSSSQDPHSSKTLWHQTYNPIWEMAKRQSHQHIQWRLPAAGDCNRRLHRQTTLGIYSSTNIQEKQLEQGINLLVHLPSTINTFMSEQVISSCTIPKALIFDLQIKKLTSKARNKLHTGQAIEIVCGSEDTRLLRKLLMLVDMSVIAPLAVFVPSNLQHSDDPIKRQNAVSAHLKFTNQTTIIHIKGMSEALSQHKLAVQLNDEEETEIKTIIELMHMHPDIQVVTPHNIRELENGMYYYKETKRT